MRSEADGSSWRMKPLKSLKAVGQVYGPLSASRDRNPMMHDWNKVYLQNCDASSFASSVAAGPIEIQGRRLYFRGLQIMEGVIEHLLEHQVGDGTAPASFRCVRTCMCVCVCVCAGGGWGGGGGGGGRKDEGRGTGGGDREEGLDDEEG